MPYPDLKKEGPSFSFKDYQNVETFEQMSDDHFATFVALSMLRQEAEIESSGGNRVKMYFGDGSDIKEWMVGHGVKEESVEYVLREFGRVDWLDVTVVSTGGIHDIMSPGGRDDDAPCAYNLDAKHEGELMIRVRSYVLDAFEAFYPASGRFYVNRKRPNGTNA